MLGSSYQEEAMKTNQHTAEQIIRILEQAEQGDQTIAAVCRDHGIAENTCYRWRKADGGMSINEAQRLTDLEQENGRLKRLLAERVLEIDLLKALLGKKGCRWPRRVRRLISWSRVDCRRHAPVQ